MSRASCSRRPQRLGDVMLSKDTLARACSANDASTDCGMSLPDILRELSVNVDGAIHVADQRALRLALLYDGWTPEEVRAITAAATEPFTVNLKDPTLQFMLPALSMMWMDGLAAAMRAIRHAAAAKHTHV